MANQCNVYVINEVSAIEPVEGWRLCFQWCRYVYAEEDPQMGYRFIWRWPTTRKLQAARGQARIPSIALMLRLIEAARSRGWGNNLAQDAESFKIEEE